METTGSDGARPVGQQMTARRWLVIGAVAVAAQFVGRHAPNPPVDPAAAFKASQAPQQIRDLLRRSCFDCHSNETVWPWYADIAPGSWLMNWDVNRGRRQFNFSTWEQKNVFDRADLLDKMCEQVKKKEMPLPQYLLLHRSAKLTDADVAAICAWTSQEVSGRVR